MDLQQYRYSVLLVSSAPKLTQILRPLLPPGQFEPVALAPDEASARRMAAEYAYDLVIIVSPLPDGFGTKLAAELCESSGAGVMLLAKAPHSPIRTDCLAAMGIPVLFLPTTSAMVTMSLQLLCGTRQRLRRMEAKSAALEEKMQEIRIVNRAKWLLVSQLRMTEAQAHRYIEKQAMDRCITRRRIAEQILAAYE